MIRKIAGKNNSTTIKHLIKNNDEVTNIKDIANTLAETFSLNSSLPTILILELITICMLMTSV